MTAERKALTSLLLALCLLASGGAALAAEKAPPAAPEKATEPPQKGKDEAPAKPAEGTPAKPADEEPGAVAKADVPGKTVPAADMPADEDEAKAELKEAEAGTRTRNLATTCAVWRWSTRDSAAQRQPVEAIGSVPDYGRIINDHAPSRRG